MAYMYAKLKEALGGEKFSSSARGIISDWSPNSVKSLVICRDFIVVAYHTKPPKLYRLDSNEVAMDLQQNGSQGALHNLLSQRQLSCMEEFYVEGLFQNYRGALDLEGYIGKLLNEKSRLRYWGYISGANADEIIGKYGKAVINADPSYAYALDKERTAMIQYKSVGNDTWHKNYNLRPQFYKLDAENGQLHRWFVSCEKKLEAYVEAERNRLIGEGKNSAIFNLLNVDIERAEDIRLFFELYKYLNISESRDKMLICIKDAIKNSLSLHSNNKVPKINSKDILECIKEAEIPMEGKVVFLRSAYTKYGMVSNELNCELDDLVGLVKSGEGIFRFTDLLDRILNKCIDLFNGRYPNGATLLKIEVMRAGEEIPNGNLRKRLGGKDNEGGSYKGYLTVLFALCGWTTTSFSDYLKKNYKEGGI